MSKHHHRNDEPLAPFQFRVYWRLLKFVKPYWKRLTLGIACGMLVGGSLFFCMLIIPQLVGVVEPSVKSSVQTREKSLRIIETVQNAPTEEEKLRQVSEIISPDPGKDPKLAKMLSDAEDAISRFHLPAAIEGNRVTVTWPKRFEFEIVDADGKVAWQLFSIYVALFVFFWAVKCLAHYLNGYCTRWVGSRVVADLRQVIFRKLSEQSTGFYSGVDIGHLISRCTNDTSALEYAVSHSVEELTNAPLQIIGCVAAILVACRKYESFALVVTVMVAVPVLVLPLHFLGRLIRKRYKKTYARIADVFSRMHEVFSGIRVVKAFNAEDRECARFEQVNNRYFKEVVRAMRLHILISPAMEFIATSATLIFLVYSYRHGVTVTELAALLAPVIMAYRPLKDISKVVGAIQQAMAAAERFFALLDTDTALREAANPVEFTEFKSSIKLEDVSFSYGENQVLKNISLELPKGKMIAVVGETGSGKSTIANLIARFYDPSQGKVSIDGIDLRNYSIASLHRMIGIVTQDPSLFNESIASNISYGKPDATREEIEQAARLANAHDFITSGIHSDGYDTVVGEKGFRLSGGEKQRIAIARAILCNPPILILDEATSALDTVTEKLVQDALNNVMANRTVFAIAHRLSTIRQADRILVLRKGEIVEQGTEEELLAIPDGIYKNLHATQYENAD